MMDAKGQPITRPAGWGRVRATARDFHASGSWWYLLAVNAPRGGSAPSTLGSSLPPLVALVAASF